MWRHILLQLPQWKPASAAPAPGTAPNEQGGARAVAGVAKEEPTADTACSSEARARTDATLGAVAVRCGRDTAGGSNVTAAACRASCKRSLGHCCDTKGGLECDGTAGRGCGHSQDANQASCQMGCIIAAHSHDRSACKNTCMATRAKDPSNPAVWACSFAFAPTNQTFNLCGSCPAACPPFPFCGVKVLDYECEQGCDITFGCTAP